MRKIFTFVVGTILIFVIFISSTLYYQSCNNVFRKDLIKHNISSIELELESRFTIDDPGEIESIVDSINQCARKNTAEMSLTEPDGKMVLKGIEGKEVVGLHGSSEHYDFVYKGYLIRAKYKFHIP